MNGSVKFSQHGRELLYVACHIRPGSLEHYCSDDCSHSDARNLHPLFPLPEPGYQRGGLPESIGRLYGHDENARGESPAEQTSPIVGESKPNDRPIAPCSSTREHGCPKLYAPPLRNIRENSPAL